MTKTTIYRLAVIVACALLAQSVLYSQTPPEVVKLRLSFELTKPRHRTFNPVSKLLAVQREDGSVQIIDVTDGREKAVLPLTDKGTCSMQWTKDGLRLLIAYSKSAALWDARTGAKLSTTIGIRPDTLTLLLGDLTLSADEKFLLNVKRDESIKDIAFDRGKTRAQMWNLETGQMKFEIKIKGTRSRVQLSPNGKQILTSSEREENPKLWDVETGRLFATLETPYRAIFREGSEAEFTPDGRFVIQTHESGTYIWHSSSGALNTMIPFNKDGTDRMLKGFTPDGKMFVTFEGRGGSHSGTLIELRDCETGELRTSLTAPKWKDWPSQMVWTHDGRILIAASGYSKYTGRIWDVGTGTFKAAFPMVISYSRIPFDFGFRDRDRMGIHPTLPVVSTASNKFLRLWNAQTGELLQTLDNHGGIGEWSADGRLFLTFAKDLKSAQVWDVVGADLETRPRWATGGQDR